MTVSSLRLPINNSDDFCTRLHVSRLVICVSAPLKDALTLKADNSDSGIPCENMDAIKEGEFSEEKGSEIRTLCLSDDG
jgi:hypothetical protein